MKAAPQYDELERLSRIEQELYDERDKLISALTSNEHRLIDCKGRIKEIEELEG